MGYLWGYFGHSAEVRVTGSGETVGMHFMDSFSPERIAGFANSVDRLARLRALKARLDAEIIQVLGEFADVIDQAIEEGPDDSKFMDQVQRDVGIEVGAAVHIQDWSMVHMINDARPLARDYPRTLEALAQAKISRRHAMTITDIGVSLLTTDAQRAVYESRVVPKAMESSVNNLRPFARRIANGLTEVTAAEQREEAKSTREVWVSDTRDGMALFIAKLPAVLAYAAHDRLTRMANVADPTGRSIAQLRADILTDLILTGHTPAHHPKPRKVDGEAGAAFGLGDLCAGCGGACGANTGAAGAAGVCDAGQDGLFPEELAGSGHEECPECVATDGARGLGAITAQVSVTIPILALLPKEIADLIRQTPGFEQVAALDGPCELTGYGPIDTQTAFFLAGDTSGWDRILTHPISGTVLHTDRYTPSQEIKRALKARDQYCRFPNCRMSVNRCENDHTIAWSQGGPTSLPNLAYLCRYHHVFKHESGWTVSQLENGNLVWTSRIGRTYVTEPASNGMYMAVPSVPEADALPRTRAGATMASSGFPDEPPF